MLLLTKCLVSRILAKKYGRLRWNFNINTFVNVFLKKKLYNVFSFFIENMNFDIKNRRTKSKSFYNVLHKSDYRAQRYKFPIMQYPVG